MGDTLRSFIECSPVLKDDRKCALQHGFDILFFKIPEHGIPCREGGLLKCIGSNCGLKTGTKLREMSERKPNFDRSVPYMWSGNSAVFLSNFHKFLDSLDAALSFYHRYIGAGGHNDLDESICET